MPTNQGWATLVGFSIATAAAVVVVAPLIQDHLEQKRQKEKIKRTLQSLSKVKGLVDDISCRLAALEKSFVASGSDDPNDSGLDSSYYFFRSDGKRLKSKWDSYDVDAELKKIDEQSEKDKDDARIPSMSLTKIKNKLAGLEHELEAVLAFLDTVRGNEEVKAVRKNLVLHVNTQVLFQIDQLKKAIEH